MVLWNAQMQGYCWTRQHRAGVDRDMEGSTEQGKMCLQDTVLVFIVCYCMNIEWKHLNGIYFSPTISQKLIIT